MLCWGHMKISRWVEDNDYNRATSFCWYTCHHGSNSKLCLHLQQLIPRLSIQTQRWTAAEVGSVCRAQYVNYGETSICAVDVDGKLTCILGDNRWSLHTDQYILYTGHGTKFKSWQCLRETNLTTKRPYYCNLFILACCFKSCID